MPLEEKIASGRTADVYAWDNGRVVKLYHDWMDDSSIEREAHLGRIVFDAGLPVPAVGDRVTVEGQRGIVFERIDGPPMLERLLAEPSQFESYARRLAELHALVHSVTVRADLHSQRARFEWNIGRAPLNDADKARLIKHLAALPDGDALCHADFHPANILLTPRGEVILDWIDACRGNPLADVARTLVILLGDTQDNPNMSPDIKQLARTFCDTYVDCYFALRPGLRVEMDQWIPIVAAARLREGVGEAEGWLRENIL